MGVRKARVEIRKSRVRFKLKKVSTGQPRLSVYRSGAHIYAQVIDDKQQKTLASASTLSEGLKKSLKVGGNKAAAEAVGKEIATLAVKAGVKTVVFDRGSYLYHGRVKALAEAARASGLKF